MKNMALFLFLVACCPMAAAIDYDQENWNDPAKANHNWSYYDTDTPSPSDVPMTWHATGGVGGSGYVSAPLGQLETAHNPSAYWPAYLYRTLGNNQEIDLSIDDAVIKVYASDIGLTGVTPIDLKGGSLHFFIGQYLVNGPGTLDDRWSFYYNKTPVTINSGHWNVQSALPVGGDANWGVIADNDPSVSPSDLFYHPEQFGFTVFPAGQTPSGTLGLDSFSIVPEPSGILLVVSALVGLLAIKRQRKG